jgi:hypothetical protein
MQWSTLSFCLFFLLFMLCATTIKATVPQEEIYALERFYNATNGDNWLWRPEALKGPIWNFTNDVINPCNTNGFAWQGIGYVLIQFLFALVIKHVILHLLSYKDIV